MSRNSVPDKNKLSLAILPGILFALLMWLFFYIGLKGDFHFESWGIWPRELRGLIGILFMPLLHDNIYHILSNTWPVLILVPLLFFFYPEISWRVLFISWLSSGLLIWIIGNPFTHRIGMHIGASGLIYSLAGFLFFSGIIRREKALFGVSLLVTFLYGTMIWGIFPEEFRNAIRYPYSQSNISWEGHLSGFISGVVLAFLYRRIGRQRPSYIWETEDELPDDNPYWMEGADENPLDAKNKSAFQNTSDNPYTVNYTFIPDSDKKNE